MTRVQQEQPVRQLARNLSAEEVRRGISPKTLADCHLRTLVFSLLKTDPLTLGQKKKKD